MELPQQIKAVSVASFGQPAGELSQPAQYVFQYTEKTPVSLTMDTRQAPYNYGQLHPVFSQNLPEGYVRRYIHEKLLRHAHVNDIYLLAIQGDKGIGHLSYKSDIQPMVMDQLSLDDILTWSGTEALFPQLLERYYLNGLISGVQPKVLVPTGGKSSISQNELIVKTFDDEYDLLTVNEFVCMSAAKHVGLNPPDFWLSEDHSCFVIKRFDVENDRKLAFEDFAVLMAKSNDQKYQSSYEMLLKAVAQFTRSHAEVERAYRYIVFSCLIGNGDAHLKNFAIQYDIDRQNIVLAPPYDITHTLIYPTIDNKMALKMGGAKAFPSHAALLKLGRAANVKKAKEIIEETADGIQDYLNQNDDAKRMPGLEASIRGALSAACVRVGSVSSYRRDKNRKHE